MKIVFIGSQSIGHDCLNEIIKLQGTVIGVFTFHPDKHEKWEKTVDDVARENNIPLFYSEKLTVEEIKKLNPDLIVVVGYRKIFSQEILEVPKFGVVGLHASLLPHLRGQAPLNWAIINGDKKAGITMFLMDKGIDTGDIIDQKETPIDIDDTIVDVKKRIQKLAVELIKENIPLIISGKIKPRKQPNEGTYGSARIPEDGKINWSDKTIKIYNLIRGLEPTYPAFTLFNSKKLFIKSAKLIEEKNFYYGTLGQVGMTLKDGSVVVITGDGAIKILKVNFENEAEVDAKDILNSSKIRLN